MKFKFHVKGNRIISKHHLRKITGNNANVLNCEFIFDTPEWEEYGNKTAIFKSMSFNITKAVPIASDGTCKIPWEIACKPGIIICAISAAVVSNNILIDKMVTEPIQVVLITDFAMSDVTYGNKPTPSEYEQFIAEINAYIDAYYSVATIADIDAMF